jgi:hypothetical protein
VERRRRRRRREEENPLTPVPNAYVYLMIKKSTQQQQHLRLLAEQNLLGRDPRGVALRRRRRANALRKEGMPSVDGLGLDARLDGRVALRAVEPRRSTEALLVVRVDKRQHSVDTGGRCRAHGGWVCDGGGVLADEVGHGHHAGALAGAAGEVVLAVLEVAGLEKHVGDEGGLFAGGRDVVFGERGVEGGRGGAGVGALVGEGGAGARGCVGRDGDEVLGGYAGGLHFGDGHDAHGAVGGCDGGGGDGAGAGAGASAVAGGDGDGEGAEGQGAGEEERLEGHFESCGCWVGVWWGCGEGLVRVWRAESRTREGYM